MKTGHVHKFKPTSRVVPVHRYVVEQGKLVKDLITARDTLKQFVCSCGKTETVDVERVKTGARTV